MKSFRPFRFCIYRMTWRNNSAYSTSCVYSILKKKFIIGCTKIFLIYSRITRVILINIRAYGIQIRTRDRKLTNLNHRDALLYKKNLRLINELKCLSKIQLKLITKAYQCRVNCGDSTCRSSLVFPGWLDNMMKRYDRTWTCQL